MHGGAVDARVAFCEILGEENVGEFGLPVARPGVVLGHGPIDVREHQAASRSYHVASGAEIDDTDIGVGFFGGFAQCGQ